MRKITKIASLIVFLGCALTIQAATLKQALSKNRPENNLVQMNAVLGSGNEVSVSGL